MTAVELQAGVFKVGALLQQVSSTEGWEVVYPPLLEPFTFGDCFAHLSFQILKQPPRRLITHTLRAFDLPNQILHMPRRITRRIALHRLQDHTDTRHSAHTEDVAGDSRVCMRRDGEVHC